MTYIRFLILYFALVLLLAIQANAQPYGMDVLAGAKYPKVVKTIPQEFALGFFAETFGDASKVVEQAAKKGHKLIRIQLLWSDTHSFGDSDIKRIKKLAKKYEKIAQRYPGTRFELSPFCEHNVQNPDKYLDIVKDSAPSTYPVNTPWKGAFSKKYKNEIHGNAHKKPQGEYNFSYDGQDATNVDIESDKKKFKDVYAFFLWHPRFNLKWSMKDTTPRPQRNALPTKDFTRSIEYLATDRGFTDVKKNWLIKSHSEKHDAQDQKGDKLLIISPIKAKEVVLKKNGKKVGSLPYYAPFEDGRSRYYSPQMGYKYGPNLEVFINNKKHAVINGGFRDGSYR